MAKDISNGEILYSYDADRELIPASVMKLVSTATALELLGEDYRFPTSLEYDGKIENGVLHGNMYIKGSGDPTLGSSHFAPDRNKYTPDQNIFIPQWMAALKKAGIQKITGSIIADESIFDTEGISLKWVSEDMGNYYGAGCYGLSVFDNLYKLYLKTGSPGSKPEILSTIPSMNGIRFHNYLTVAPVKTDSAFIFGAPYAHDRFLYGAVPVNRERYLLRGDIPDPPLFLAQYLHGQLSSAGIVVEGEPTSYRILSENNKWPTGKRTVLTTTYSPTVREIVHITNERSHNLYADALLKAIGTQYSPRPREVISSFGKGVQTVHAHWKGKGLDTSPLWMFDGSGLAPSNKVSASFICDLLAYMATESEQSEAFIGSLPRAGMEGSVINFLRGTPLQGVAKLKSGGMSRVRAYAGYISKGNKTYAVTIIVNNYSGEGRKIIKDIERVLVSLF